MTIFDVSESPEGKLLQIAILELMNCGPRETKFQSPEVVLLYLEENLHKAEEFQMMKDRRICDEARLKTR
jgi:hypothetical protein